MMGWFASRCRSRLVGLVALTLAGCAAPSLQGQGPEGEFARSGRFSVSVQESSGQQDGVQGGFVWRDQGRQLVLDLTNPLGSTLARVTVSRSGALLERSNGSRETAQDPDALVEQVLGNPIPVAGLRDWLRGRTGTDAARDVQNDGAGRPESFSQRGWQVRLSRYDDLGPTLLQLNRHDAGRRISVRLAVSPS